MEFSISTIITFAGLVLGGLYGWVRHKSSCKTKPTSSQPSQQHPKAKYVYQYSDQKSFQSRESVFYHRDSMFWTDLSFNDIDDVYTGLFHPADIYFLWSWWKHESIHGELNKTYKIKAEDMPVAPFGFLLTQGDDKAKWIIGDDSGVAIEELSFSDNAVAVNDDGIWVMAEENGSLMFTNPDGALLWSFDGGPALRPANKRISVVQIESSPVSEVPSVKTTNSSTANLLSWL